MQFNNAPIEAIFLFVIWCMLVFTIDAIIVGMFSNSIGKALFRIQVKNKANKSIDFNEALSRNFDVYIYGFWGGIPLVSLIPQYLESLRLRRTGKTSWDNSYSVEQKHVGLGRGLGIILGFFILWMMWSSVSAVLASKMAQSSHVAVESSYPLAESAPVAEVQPAPSSAFSLKNIEGQWQRIDVDGKTILTISNLTPAGFNFKISGSQGHYSGDIDGNASVLGGVAEANIPTDGYGPDKYCNITMKRDALIHVTESQCFGFHGMNFQFQGSYRRYDSPKVISKAGNIFIASGNEMKQMTFSGNDVSPDISPNGSAIVFEKESERASYNPEYKSHEIWMMDISENEQGLLVAPDSTQIGGFDSCYSPKFSPDGLSVIFSCSAWATANAIHRIDLKTKLVKYLSPGTAIRFVRKGKYAGEIIAKSHKYYDGGESYNPYILIDSNGKEILELGETSNSVSNAIGENFADN